jgi:hypothetical protein
LVTAGRGEAGLRFAQATLDGVERGQRDEQFGHRRPAIRRSAGLADSSRPAADATPAAAVAGHDAT